MRLPLSSLFSLLFATFVAFSGSKVSAQLAEAGDGHQSSVTTPHLTAELVSLTPDIAPGGSHQVGLVMHLEDHWHVYWSNPGYAGTPPAVQWSLPQDITASPLRFPVPSRIAQGEFIVYGYENTVAFPITVNAAKSAASGPVHLDAHVHWLVCREVCLPGRAHLGLGLRVQRRAQPPALTGALGEAIQALPRQLPSNTTVSVLAGSKDFVLTLADGHPSNTAEFYPLDPDQIADAGPQTVESTSDGLRIHIPRAPDLTKLPATLHGVLKVSGGNSFEVNPAVVRGDTPAVSGGTTPSRSAQSSLTVGTAVTFAFLGGIILNLMPCVFPVLFLKGLALVQSSQEERGRLRAHGLVYTLGILVSFWILVGVLLLLRAGGSHAGWGFQLQSPAFLVVLASFVFFLGLSLAGQFDLGLSLTSAGGSLANKEGLAGSFFTGILATVVATPCTAPLMGAAIGFAFTQPVVLTFLIFTALGTGLAVPYLLLTLQPVWTRWLPRPGAWMETLKQATALPLFATAIWLVWVYGRLYSPDSVAVANHMARLLCCLLLLALAGWTLHKWSTQWGSTVAVIAIGCIALAIPLSSSSSRENVRWEPYSQARLDQARADGRPVLIDFTAAWCLSCQINEQIVLKAHDIESELSDHHVVTLRADWTQYDPEITRQLTLLGRSGVPAYVIYPADRKKAPDVLPELLTKSLVKDAIVHNGQN